VSWILTDRDGNNGTTAAEEPVEWLGHPTREKGTANVRSGTNGTKLGSGSQVSAGNAKLNLEEAHGAVDHCLVHTHDSCR